jgi:(1->4)-alpha-D-glucan 1-alpha-D-glucosylmutase
VRRFAATVAMPGVYNALAQLVLKATAPGVPDFYQGTELWDLSLVDPDNRRPVDYERRRALLAELTHRAAAGDPALCAELMARPADGAIKMLVTQRALQHRRSHLALFEKGSYAPLAPDGTRRQHVVAFARANGGTISLTVVGRFFAALGAAERPPVGEAVWADTRLPLDRSWSQGDYRDVLTGQVVRATGGGELRLADLFTCLPVAIVVPA